MIVIATIISIAFFFLFSVTSSTPNVNEAVRIVGQSINHKIDPCDNFYDYACGNWSYHNSKPDHETTWNTFKQMERKTFLEVLDILQQPVHPHDTKSLEDSKLLFIECMNEESHNEHSLKQVLNQIGGWPLLNSKWKSADFDWWEFIGKVKNLYGVNVLLQVGTQVENPIALYPVKAAVTLDKAAVYRNDDFLKEVRSRSEIRNGYRTLIENIAKELDYTSDPTHLKQKVDDIVNFEIKLSEILTNEVGNFDHPLTGSTVGQIQYMYAYVMQGTQPEVNLMGYLKEVFRNNAVSLSPSTEMNVPSRWYLYKLLHLIEKTPREIVANYVVWRVIAFFAPYSNKAITKALFEFDHLFLGIEGQVPRSQTCASLAYGPGVAQKYSELHINPDIKQVVNDMSFWIEYMINSFITNSKLDRLTKITAQMRVAKVVKCIGYPEWLKDSNFLDQRYFLRELDSEKLSLMEKIVLILRSNKDLYLNDLQEEKCEWSLSRRDFNIMPYYNGGSNTINFPMGYLQPQIYSKDAPISIKFGALGTALGHEIAHTLPSIGWTKDIFGNLSDIGKCFEDEYKYLSSLKPLSLEAQKLNIGNLSENHPDNVGVTAAFYAYKHLVHSTGKDDISFSDDNHVYTEDQLFFLAFAQHYCEVSTTAPTTPLQQSMEPHASGIYRVLGSLRNFPEFSKAWQCHDGTFMNPESKCNAFGD